jgi:hypothetical protein
MMCAGSANNAAVKLGKLEATATAKLPDKVAALWADRCNLKNTGNCGGPAETNHYMGSSPDLGIPVGGNVGSADGSVQWFTYKPGYSSGQLVPGHYTVNAGTIGTHIAIPSNSLWPICDSSGNLDTGTNMTGGSVNLTFSKWF